MKPQHRCRSGRCVGWFAAAGVAGWLAVCVDGATAQEEAAEVRPALARFITVSSPVEDGKIINTALKLQSQASRENREAILILEITRGPDKFGHIFDLANFLTSARISKVRTVAWLPETLDGNKAILALACREIIMHPDAKLGDIGQGAAVDPEQKQFVLGLVAKRHNPKLSSGLALGMLDPQVEVLKLKLGLREGETETRIVTEEEYRRLSDTKVDILHVQTLKDRGIVGLFSGRQARAEDILIVQTAESRNEIADLYNLPVALLRDNPTSEGAHVAVIRIDSIIEPVLEAFIERQIERSLAKGANLLIFEIDSPGGWLQSSENLAFAIARLDPKRVRTVAYVPHRALSGAAIIALACDQIYMHPHAHLGDAGPIEMREGGQFQHAEQKVLSDLRLTMKELAEKKGRPVGLAMAMADRNLRVYEATHKQTGRVWYMTEDELAAEGDAWRQGRLVPESAGDLLLTVDGRRAHELKLAEPPVENEQELKQRLDLPADFNLQAVAVGRTWVDTLIFVLNTGPAMFLLIVIGIVCIYLELHFMTGFLGIVSTLCFALFFWSRFLGGTAGWLEVILFLLGLGCIALEIFVIPGFGVFGVSGGLLVLASLLLASQTFGNYEPDRDISQLARNVGVLSGSILAVVVLGVLISRYLPHMPVLNTLILAPPGTRAEDDEPRLRPDIAGDETPAAHAEGPLVGKRGTAISVLRPAGKARIEGRYVDVVSNGPFVQPGSEIEVISVRGNVVVVREVT